MFTGIDVERARQLIGHLARWSGRADDIQALILEAEALADIPTGARPRVDEFGRCGRELASTVAEAVDRIEGHRLDADVAIDGLALRGGLFEAPEATAGLDHRTPEGRAALLQAAVDRQRRATAEGRMPDPADQQLAFAVLAQAGHDEASAATALALAMRGLPADLALGLDSPAALDDLFRRVSLAMQRGAKPGSADLHRSLFPPAYASWHDAMAPGGAPVQLVGPIGLRFDLDRRGRADAFGALVSLAEHHGVHASAWLGRELADRLAEADSATQTTIGRLAAADAEVALQFFNRLGVEGTARLPAELISAPVPEPHAAVGPFAAALALASTTGALGFGGGELIEADAAASNPHRPGWAQVELLLQADGFDTDFLVDAVARSVELRLGEQHFDQRLSAGHGGPIDLDPTSLAIAAALRNGTCDRLVDRLWARGSLDPLLFGDPLAAPHPYVDELPLPPVQLLLTAAGQSPHTADRVIRHFAAKELPQALRADTASGLSGLLTLAAPHQLDASSQERFLDVYRQVLGSGSGLEVSLGTGTLVRKTVENQLDEGRSIPDLGAAAQLAGRIEGTRHLVHANDAQLAEQAQTRLGITLSGAGVLAGSAATGTGLVAAAAGPVGLVIGVIGLGLAFWSARRDAGKRIAAQEIQRLLARDTEVVGQALIATLSTGRVEDAEGRNLELVTHHGGYALRAFDGASIDLGDLSSEVDLDRLADLRLRSADGRSTIPLSHITQELLEATLIVDEAHRQVIAGG